MSSGDAACPVYLGGSQKGMLEGDISAHVHVADLLGREHLYAVGPREGVRGEITVVDSIVYLTVIDEKGRWRVTNAPDAAACFLVWSYVSRWVECEIVDSPKDLNELEGHFAALAQQVGLPVTGPLPFLVEAEAPTVALHALAKHDDGVHTLERHHEAKVHAAIEGRPVIFVGFFAEKGYGPFTPPDSTVHCHVCTTDAQERVCGHVDAVRFGDGAVKVFLPDLSSCGGM